MDYGLVPGTTAYEKAMRELLKNRSVSLRTDTNIADFVTNLETSPQVTRPVDNLFVASHANDEGWLMIQLDSTTPVHQPNETPKASFEDLQKVDTAGSINIPSAVLDPRPTDSNGDPIPANFNIRGCRIGQQPDYLTELKTALGGAVNVTAPKFFHIVYTYSKEGYMEFMAYSFEVHSKTPFDNCKDLVDEYINNSTPYDYYDGTSVPDDRWNLWVPTDVKKLGKTPIPLKITIDPPIGKHKSISTNMGKKAKFLLGEFRHNREHFGPWRINYTGGTPPADKDQQIADFKDGLLNRDPDGKFKDTHPFPVYKRYGYDTFDEMMDGWDWTTKVDGSTLVIDGYRHLYICSVPVVDYSNDHVFYNFFPNAGAAGLTQVIQLKEDDDQFFATV